MSFPTSASWLRGSRTSFSICSSCSISSEARRFSASPHTSIIFLSVCITTEWRQNGVKIITQLYLCLIIRSVLLCEGSHPLCKCNHTSSWQNTTQKDDNVYQQLCLCWQSMNESQIRSMHCHHTIYSCPQPGDSGLVTVCLQLWIRVLDHSHSSK